MFSCAQAKRQMSYHPRRVCSRNHRRMRSEQDLCRRRLCQVAHHRCKGPFSLEQSDLFLIAKQLRKQYSNCCNSGAYGYSFWPKSFQSNLVNAAAFAASHKKIPPRLHNSFSLKRAFQEECRKIAVSFRRCQKIVYTVKAWESQSNRPSYRQKAPRLPQRKRVGRKQGNFGADNCPTDGLRKEE